MEFPTCFDNIRGFLRGCCPEGMEVFTLPLPIRTEEKLNVMKQLCNYKKPVKYCIAHMYKIITGIAEPRIPPFIEKWEKELGTEFPGCII